MPFKFSVGPWNVSSGADVYGPATRSEIPMEEKIRKFKELGNSIPIQIFTVVPLSALGKAEHNQIALPIAALQDTLP